MGYRIVYGEEPVRWQNRKLRAGRVAACTAVCLMLFGTLTVKFWPEGAEVLQEALLPGDAAVTRQALENMADNLKAGEAIGDAVVVFCREIVDGAQLTD